MGINDRSKTSDEQAHREEWLRDHKGDGWFKLYAMQTGHVIFKHSPGMRIIKTGLAILLCFAIDSLRLASNYYDAAIATIVCLQADVKSSWNSGWSRTLGTMVAGIFSIGFLLVVHHGLDIPLYSKKYLLLLGLSCILIMQFFVLINKPSSMVIGTIVFVLICVTDRGTMEPFSYVTGRVLNTMVGVLSALFVNWLPILNRWGEKYDRSRARAYVDAELVEERMRELDRLHREVQRRREEEYQLVKKLLVEDLERHHSEQQQHQHQQDIR